MLDAREVRRKLHAMHLPRYASVPIRLMSKICQDARREFAAAGQAYDGYAGAIGDIAADSMPADLRHALYFDREDEVRREGERRLHAETKRHTSYDYAGTGFDCLKQAWLDVYRPLSPETDHLRPYPFYGGLHAFSVVIQAIARLPGAPRRVLLPVPAFPPFIFQLGRHFERICQPTDEQHGLRLQASQVAGIAPEDLRLVYLCIVGNPTGLSYGADELRELLAAIVRRQPEALLLLDAVYLRTLPSDQVAALWRAMADPAWRRNAIIFDSLSKTCGRTGLRSGVAFLANEQVEQSMIDLIQNELAGFSYAMQIESVGLLRLVKEDAVQGLAREIAKRREWFLTEQLPRHAEYFLPRAAQTALPPHDYWQGGLYVFLRLQPQVQAPEYFIESGVACVPGEAFYGPGQQFMPGPCLRISFGMEAKRSCER